LGHEVIFLIGDGTGQAGDPTGKKQTREKFFTKEELRANAKNYVAQASKIIRFKGSNSVKILYNSDWLDKLTKVEILNIAQNFSVQQLIERDMFQERLKAGEPINLREFLYPLLQGYDSVAMDVDLELGGTDQTFNMLAGRTLMKAMKGKEKFVMTTPLLSDSRGIKIGKSEGNTISLTDEPNDLFGKIMSLADDAIIPIFTLLTDVSLEDIVSFDIKKNPLELKKSAAHIIVSQLYSEKLATKAQDNFEKTFTQGNVPENITQVTVARDASLSDILLTQQLIVSKSELRRLVSEGAITNMATNEKVTDPNSKVSSATYKIGKHRFIKIQTL